jgi:hypothetical protein
LEYIFTTGRSTTAFGNAAANNAIAMPIMTTSQRTAGGPRGRYTGSFSEDGKSKRAS